MIYRTLEILGDRHVGFILCLIVILNLAAGSLVMNMNPELYPPFFPFDLTFFFRPALTVHWWLYLLLITFSLFAVNMVACFIESLIRLKTATTGRHKLFIGIFIHAALILTMAAHVYDGFYGTSGQATLTPKATSIAGIGDVTALSVHNSYHPDGSLKDTEVALKITQDNGQSIGKRMAYNEPAIFDGGQREIIVQSGQERPVGVVLVRKSDGAVFDMMPYQPHQINGGQLTLKGVYQSPMRVLIAEFVWEKVATQPQLLTMALHAEMVRHNKITVADEQLEYKEMLTVPVVAVMTRYNPAVPIILLGLLAASIGTLLQISFARRQASTTPIIAKG